MRAKKTSRVTRAFEETLAASRTGKYILRLYVAGATARSRQTLLRVRRLAIGWAIHLAQYDREMPTFRMAASKLCGERLYTRIGARS